MLETKTRTEMEGPSIRSKRRLSSERCKQVSDPLKLYNGNLLNYHETRDRRSNLPEWLVSIMSRCDL